MPALKVLGQPMIFAAEDLRLVAVAALLLRTLQIAFLIPALVYLVRLVDTPPSGSGNNNKASLGSQYGREFIIAYWTLATVTALFSIVLEVFIFRDSSRGSPVETEARKQVPYLCAIKLIPLSALRVATMAMGILSVMSIRDYCRSFGIENELVLCPDKDAMQTVFTALAVTHIMEIGVAVLLYLYFVFHACQPRKRLRSFVLATGQQQRQQEALLWRCWCNVCCALTSICCCCLLGGREAVLKGDFGELSLVLADFFDQGNNKNGEPILDVTVSDWMAGLTMLSAEQEEQRLHVLQQIRKQQSKLDRCDEEQQQQGASEEEIEAGAGVDATGNVEKGNNERLEEGTGALGRNHEEGIGIAAKHRGMQLRRSAAAEYYYEMTDRIPLECSNSNDAQLMHDGAHFMRLAMAVYGYIQYIFQRPCQAPCCLTAAALTFQSCRRTYNNTVATDMSVVNGDFCGCDENALFQVAGIDSQDLVYASFKTGVGICPYCIVLDRPKKAVVVVIRGTMSLEAALTDLAFKPELLDDHCKDIAGLNENTSMKGEHCHSGMLQCAKWIYKDLENHKLLDRLLLRNETDFSAYSIIVSGHSLGAGVAAVLACMLKTKFPLLTGLCFEPPGCVLSKHAAAQHYITSYVFNADIIPRLSLQSLEYIRNDTLEMIARIKVPKHKLLTANLQRVIEEEEKQESDKESGLRQFVHRQESIPESLFRRQLQAFHRYQDELADEQGAEFRVQLYPPGKIIHLVKDHEMSSTYSGFLTARSVEYTPIWAPAEDFAKIQISRSFASDHDPHNVLKALEEASDAFMRPSETSYG